jgi:hypothetical protein
MEKRHTIIESVTRHLGSKGFDVTPTLEISHEAANILSHFLFC